MIFAMIGAASGLLFAVALYAIQRYAATIPDPPTKAEQLQERQRHREDIAEQYEARAEIAQLRGDRAKAARYHAAAYKLTGDQYND